MEQTNKHYRFAAISDVHIDLENGGKNTYFIYAEENFLRTLRAAKERGCEFIVSVGDQVTNASGAKEEWLRYRELIAESGYGGLVLEALGNHELRYSKYGGCTAEDEIGEFIRYAKLPEKPVLCDECKPYYEYLHPLFGDSFLFMATESGYDVNALDNFSDEQMEWAEKLVRQRLEEGRRVFLIQHAPLYGFGAGDDKENPAYEGSVRTSDSAGNPFKNNRRFRELTENHKEVIWLSGHTHLRFEDERNYSNDNGEACHMLHIPALSGTTRLTYDEEGRRILDRAFREDEAQGYIVDVYEDRVVFSGFNFISDRFYPSYIYTI